MDKMKYLLWILFFCMSTSFSTHTSIKYSINPLMQGIFDTWLGDYSASIFLILEDENISSIVVEENCNCKPLVGKFELHNINTQLDTLDYYKNIHEYSTGNNKFIFSQARKSTLKKVNNLLQIHISPKFSRESGGEIALSYKFKKQWETLRVFIAKDSTNTFFLYKQELIDNQKQKTLVDTLYVDFDWRLRIEDVTLH